MLKNQKSTCPAGCPAGPIFLEDALKSHEYSKTNTNLYFLLGAVLQKYIQNQMQMCPAGPILEGFIPEISRI